MATWRPIGSLEPRTDSWLLLPELPTGNFFRLSCLGVPSGSQSFIQLQEWRNQKTGAIRVLQPMREQCFEWGEPGERLISIRKGYPMRAAHDLEEYQVILEEWIEQAPVPDFVQNSEPPQLWLPGNH